MTIVVSGLTGSGKTTLSKTLCRLLDCNPVRTSDFMLQLLGDNRPKSERMIGWKTQQSTEVDSSAFEAGVEADRMHHRQVQESAGGVHESLALPILLEEGAACRVFLATDDVTRFVRVAGREQVDLETARVITSRKDRRTQVYLEKAYGLAIPSVAYLHHFDALVHPVDGGTLEVVRTITPEVESLLQQALAMIKESVS